MGRVGYVHEVSGDVRAAKRQCRPQERQGRRRFDPGRDLRTGADGKVVIKFETARSSRCQPNAVFRVDGYSFNVNNPKAGNSALSLLKARCGS